MDANQIEASAHRGSDLVTPMANTSYAACKATCDKLNCHGFCFENDQLTPDSINLCYVKNMSKFSDADLSYSNHCKGSSSPSDCPYNIYRTSGESKAQRV